MNETPLVREQSFALLLYRKGITRVRPLTRGIEA